MKVFKFGGASVNSAAAVRNMAEIVRRHHDVPLLVVVSAMGKTTNALEKLVLGGGQAVEAVSQVADYHQQIVRELDIENRVGESLQALLDSLRCAVAQYADADTSCYDQAYDSIVSYGELISTTIVSAYLESIGMANRWEDVRQLIVTDNNHREGRVQWDQTSRKVRDRIKALLHSGCTMVVTQGFIAGGSDGTTTTLGREGSDYSAAILSYALGAESMTIWKDVDGFLDADPKYFANTRKIARIPYNEAIELAYYGASVIHPKTVKPLQNKNIPLFIKSFLVPDAEGSTVGPYKAIEPLTPLYIVKGNQVLLSIMPKDFSFIAEDNLQKIFGVLSDTGVKVNMMQNSALSFSLCVDDNELLLSLLRTQLSDSFKLRYNRGLQLITVRYYNEEVVQRVVAGRGILLQQRSRNTIQLVVVG
ncbi:MAG: aspartate kinase [Bacteroidales bacterium]|nr:aspartate kinase [Bacteroidales bacterium]